jgi:putative transposase
MAVSGHGDRLSHQKVIGYAMGEDYKTWLISEAIERAAANMELPEGAIFHSDRGSNYTSQEFAETLAGLGILQSVGRTGICFDNAMAESFFGGLKVERVHRTQYPTREHARRDIARCIEFRYNTRRIHSGLGCRTPQEVLDAYIDRLIGCLYPGSTVRILRGSPPTTTTAAASARERSP